jgi:hypothetical protein
VLRLLPDGGGAGRRLGPGSGHVGRTAHICSGEISSAAANLVPSWPAGLAFYAASLVTTDVGLVLLEQQPGSLAFAPRSARLARITTTVTEALASPTLATGQLPTAPAPAT